MISLEALCYGAMGKRFIWADCFAQLELLVGIAAPYLALLPHAVNHSMVPDELLPVIGASMSGVIEMLRIFAQQEETVVLSGPTGAGKSRLALWCHQQSPQREQHFETLDLSTIPEDLQMAEFFGWKKGAFTGATRDTPGSLARAENGTLFIDEIDKLSLKVQAGLLRVLEERRYRPLGDVTGDRSASVRFIIGTNADLFSAVRAGHFREDLYYRLNVLPVKIPPLDERKDEIPKWARYMLERRRLAAGKEGGVSLSPEAEQTLRSRSWPGNLRQLDNIVRRAYALSLMEKVVASAELIIRASHIEKALTYESGASSVSLLELMTLTAVAFIAEAERHRSRGDYLDLDHTDALRGFVLGIAAQKLGSREEAYRLVGKGALVDTRNHQKSIKREIEKVEALCRIFGQEEKSPFHRINEGNEP
jgi:DNA-binding NtrC family response regulator